MTAAQPPYDVIDGLDVLVCGLDDAGTIACFNRSCEQVTGVIRDRAIGRSWLELFASIHTHDDVRGLWRLARAGRSVAPHQALSHNGRTIRWQFSNCDRASATPMLWAVGMDVSRERVSMVTARQLERKAALDNMVAGLAHELRNPLNGAMLQLAVAERHIARNEQPVLDPARQAIAQATAEVRRTSRLLDDFLVFARPLPLVLARVDLRAVVDRAIDRARHEARHAGVTIAPAPGDPVVAEIDPGRVEDAIHHLLANAVHAAAQAEDRAVGVRIATLGGNVAIEIEDHGAGVSEDAPVFDPFFTTKQHATGLGLAIVERVATDHGGSITYDRRDHATVFRLALPIVGGLAGA